MAGRVGRVAPQPVARFAFEDRLLRSLAAGAARRSAAPAALGGALFREALSRDDRAASAAHLVRAPRRRAGRGAARARRACGACATWWRRELERDLSLDDLAGAPRDSAARTSPAAFRATTGQTPYGYLRARRVERARRLLHGTDLPAAAIAGPHGLQLARATWAGSSAR